MTKNKDFKSKDGVLEAMAEWRFTHAHCASGFKSGRNKTNVKNIIVAMSSEEYKQFIKLVRSK